MPSARLSHSDAMCEAHSHSNSECQAHSQLCYGCEAHSHCNYKCETHRYATGVKLIHIEITRVKYDEMKGIF